MNSSIPKVAPAAIDVVAGVLRNKAGAVLLAQRPFGKIMAGRWEFPGGKLLDHEAPITALSRELREELGVAVADARPLIHLHHDYPDLTVRLHVLEVERYDGEPQALENQPLAWVPVAELPDWDMLEADRAVVAALRLPDRVLVTPPPTGDRVRYLEDAANSLSNDIRLMQCRLPNLEPGERLSLGRELRQLCAREHVAFIWNGRSEDARSLRADGLHLSAERLLACEDRPHDARHWVGASCHNEDELLHAHRLKLDYVFVGPVEATPSHPGVEPMGWEGFERLVNLSNIPVYAIGGMTVRDIPQVRTVGGQGIAVIRALWSAQD